MSLKFEMDSLEGLHESVAGLYTENNGKYVLSGIEGVSPKSKINEFRTTNIELTNALKEFEGIDPAKYKSMNTEIEELKIRLDKTDLDEEQIEKIVVSRVEAMKTEFDTNSQALTSERDSLAEQVNSLVLDGATKEAALEHGIADTALDDVINRVRKTFSIVDGKAIGKDAEGNPLFDATGIKEITINEWVKGLVKTASHLFKPSVQSTIKGKVGFTGDTSKMTPAQKISAGLSR